MSFSKRSAFSVKRAWPPSDDATPNIFPDSKSVLLGLSNEVSFVSGYCLEGGQNSQNI